MKIPDSKSRFVYVMQGLEQSASYRNALKWILTLPDLEGCVISSAYADSRGIGLVLDELLAARDKVSVYLGINNGSTEYEAICDLVDNGIRITGIDTSNRETIFHQKAFLSWSPSEIRVVIGSANLTHHGLLQNYEGGLLLGLDAKKEPEIKDQIINSLEDLSKRFPDNFIEFNDEVLEDNKDLLITHADKVSTMISRGSSETKTRKNPPMKPEVDPEFGYRKYTRSKTHATAAIAAKGLAPQIASVGDLIWTQKISRRHISLPKRGTNTHKTGAFNLGKGQAAGLAYNKNFQTYYHNVIFKSLDWSTNTKTSKDEADAWFKIILDGEEIGTYRLTITFTQASKTVRQKNTTTSIRWGQELIPIISNEKYLKGTISLYRSDSEEDGYVIELTSK